VVGDLKTVDGKTIEGSPDPLGERCMLREHVGGEGTDRSKSTSVGMSGHTGAHTEGGMGHIEHWDGFDKTGMLGLWEYPLDAFYGEAVVCDLSSAQGGPITPEHLGNVRKDDIVLVWSPHTRQGTPYIPAETADWLVETGIRMLGVQMPGIHFDTAENTTHIKLLSNNIPITYPLENLDKLKSDRVFYMGLPIKIARMEATWIRAIAIEEP